MGGAAGSYDVTDVADDPRSVVDLEQIMDAPSDEDILTPVESARGEAQMNVVAQSRTFVFHFLKW